MEPHDGHRPVDVNPDLPDADAPTPPAAAPAGATAPVVASGPVAAPRAGNETVAAALQELATVGQRPLAEHPDSFARVHSGLQQALSDIDDA